MQEFSQISLIIVYILIGFLFLTNFFLFWKVKKLEKKNKILFKGKKVQNLEEVILNHGKDIVNLDKEIQELFNISNKIYNLSFKGLHKVGVIRFNPFRDIGGDQSFAIALLDGNKNGLVLSALHTREGTRIYTKPITKGNSKYPLSKEEKEAVKKALGT